MLGRNDPCYCGGGRKYKRCHLDQDREAVQVVAAALPELRHIAERGRAASERLRTDFGVYVNHVLPIQHEGRKVWAIGTRLYPDRPPNETFHEFVIHILRETLGEAWRAEQAALPDKERHFILRCSEAYSKWKAENADPEALDRDGRFGAFPNGWVQSFISLAWDVASLIQASNLPYALVDRLRDARAYQGARYEIAVAAMFARLDFEVEFLDEDAQLRSQKHVEFVVTHRPSGQQIAVEAKSRHRAGVLNEEGDADPDDPLRGDMRGVRGLFVKAVEKAPENIPFVIFIDINAPLDPAEPFEKEWQQQVKTWLGRFREPTAETPDIYNALVITNFSPHYSRDDLAQAGEWLAVVPFHTRVPIGFDLMSMLSAALDNYGRVPDIREDGEIGD